MATSCFTVSCISFSALARDCGDCLQLVYASSPTGGVERQLQLVP